MSSPIASGASGASSDGLRTTVLPATSAGPRRAHANIAGWLNVIIRPTTPHGSRRV